MACCFRGRPVDLAWWEGKRLEEIYERAFGGWQLSRRAVTVCCLIAGLLALQADALFPSSAYAGTITASDNFARATVAWANWTDMTVGGLGHSNQDVTGSMPGGTRRHPVQ